jgi:hypothetical protein
MTDGFDTILCVSLKTYLEIQIIMMRSEANELKNEKKKACTDLAQTVAGKCFIGRK